MSKNINKNEYKSYAERHAPKSPIVKDCALAFIVGGVICTLGEVLNKVYGNFLSKEDAGLLASVTLIFITALLTGIGVFDNIARFGGLSCSHHRLCKRGGFPGGRFKKRGLCARSRRKDFHRSRSRHSVFKRGRRAVRRYILDLLPYSLLKQTRRLENGVFASQFILRREK